MNERIRELVKQAGLNIDGYGYPIWGCLDGEDEKKEFVEKFAELIVQECAWAADFADNEPGDYVLKHFGVEE